MLDIQIQQANWAEDL
ncbi:hypothetical protein [Kingella sp. (in: b-proteobacteria)]